MFDRQLKRHKSADSLTSKVKMPEYSHSYFNVPVNKSFSSDNYLRRSFTQDVYVSAPDESKCNPDGHEPLLRIRGNAWEVSAKNGDKKRSKVTPRLNGMHQNNEQLPAAYLSQELLTGKIANEQIQSLSDLREEQRWRFTQNDDVSSPLAATSNEFRRKGFLSVSQRQTSEEIAKHGRKIRPKINQNVAPPMRDTELNLSPNVCDKKMRFSLRTTKATRCVPSASVSTPNLHPRSGRDDERIYVRLWQAIYLTCTRSSRYLNIVIRYFKVNL